MSSKLNKIEKNDPEHKAKSKGPVHIEKEKLLPYIGVLFLFSAAYLIYIIYISFFWLAFIALVIYASFQNFHLRVGIFLARNKITLYSRTWAALISTTIATSIIVIPCFIIIKQLLGEVIHFILAIQDFYINEQAIEKLEQIQSLTNLLTLKPFLWVDIYNVAISISKEINKYIDPNQLKNWLGNIFEFLGGGVGFTMGVFVDLLLTILIVFFLFKDGPSFYLTLRKNLPFSQNITDNFQYIMQKTISDLVKGNILVSVFQGIAIGFALEILGFENVFSYGLLAAIFSTIPLIGTSPIWIPASLYLIFIKGKLASAIILSIYSLGIYLYFENILRPKMLVSKLGLHPLFIFFAILGGLFKFGLAGVFLGPLFLVLAKTIWNIYHLWDSNEIKK